MTQTKIMEEPSLVFTYPWFRIYFRLRSGKYGKYKIVSRKMKKFENLDFFLVSFELYFVKYLKSAHVFTMYYLLL
jgi:hypothetical protein